MAETGLSDETIMGSAGHMSREMLDHYSHIRLMATRKDLEVIETPIPEPRPVPEE